MVPLSGGPMKSVKSLINRRQEIEQQLHAMVWSMPIASMPAAPLLDLTRFIALSRFSLAKTSSKSPDPVLSGS